MIESFEASPKPHAYLVAGGGGGMRSTIVLRMIAQELSERDIPFTPIDGVYIDDDVQKVNYPSLQMQDIEADIDNHSENTPLLFISHCIGTIAALSAIEKIDSVRQASIVSIAPPLPSPRSTIAQPQSQGRRCENNTLMRVVDLPAGAVDYSVQTESFAYIDPKYFEDIETAGDLEQRLRARVETGEAVVYAPEHDWNAGSPRSVQAWHEEWDATLSSEEAAALKSRAPIIHDAAHGLYISARGTGRDVSAHESVGFQIANVNNVVDTGLQLAANSRTSVQVPAPVMSFRG